MFMPFELNRFFKPAANSGLVALLGCATAGPSSADSREFPFFKKRVPPGRRSLLLGTTTGATEAEPFAGPCSFQGESTEPPLSPSIVADSSLGDLSSPGNVFARENLRASGRSL